MKKEKLINAIKETIIDLETGRRQYNWGDATSCNCGLLAVNLGAKNLDCYAPLTYSNGVACAKTGTMLFKVIRLLTEAGMSYDDIEQLEKLSNSDILKEAGLAEPSFYFVKENVLAYFRAWLRILEREENPAPQELPYRTVVIDSKVKSLTEKEIIYS